MFIIHDLQFAKCQGKNQKARQTKITFSKIPAKETENLQLLFKEFDFCGVFSLFVIQLTEEGLLTSNTSILMFYLKPAFRFPH